MILKSRTLSRTSDTTETRNLCVIKVVYFLIYLISSDENFCFYAEVNFWDFVRNDNSNKGTTARLNETRFGPNKKLSPIYLGPKSLDTFWWNCQIIFRCASIHGRAGFILFPIFRIQTYFFYICLKNVIKYIILCIMFKFY